MDSDNVLIAKIIDAYGVKGFVKIKTFTESPRSIFKYTPIFDRFLKKYNLKFVRMCNSNIVIAYIEGVCSRNMAEAFKGLELFVSRSSILKDDEMLLSDFVGFEVRDRLGCFIGNVVKVLNFGAGDILEINIGRPITALLSYNKNSVCNVDINQRIIIIDREHLLEN